jgi:hypothetical protein
MSYECVDCRQPIDRKHSRGAIPKRCEKCRKLRVASKQKACYQKLRDQARRKDEFRKCCECGNCPASKGKRGPAKLRCDLCNKKRQQEVRRIKYQESKKRHRLTCRHCGCEFSCCLAKQAYCSRACMHLGQRKRVVAKCARPGCGNDFVAKKGQIESGRRYCSRECTYNPKKTCKNPACQKLFRPKYARGKRIWMGKGFYCCRECFHDHRYGSDRRRKPSSPSARRSALCTSLRKKCKILGVPHDPECTREAVCERDNWTCQMCGIKCVKEHGAKPLPVAAEHDHMIALTTRGSLGNVFPNSQCLCRSCNSRKSAKSWGQLRLDFEESIQRWENGGRNRRQRRSKLFAEIPASVA